MKDYRTIEIEQWDLYHLYCLSYKDCREAGANSSSLWVSGIRHARYALYLQCRYGAHFRVRAQRMRASTELIRDTL